MAGAGYKLFNTGDVLTAAQVNTYLQEQTVMVFADAAARTAALSGVLAEGMMSYLKSTDAVEVYNGSAWVGVSSDQTPLTTKGDLFTYSTTDARLAVGNNGETLLADSSTSTGLRWQGLNAAGKNVIFNSAFDIWQRGTSFAYPGGTTYTADRWTFGSGATGRTTSRQTSGLATSQYNIRCQRDSGNTNTATYKLSQSLESVDSRKFAGKAFTLSFQARAGANYSAASNALAVEVRTGTGTDQNIDSGYTGSASPVNQTATLTTSWQRFTYTGTASSSATEIGIIFTATPVGTAGANDYFEIAEVQLELGSVATEFGRQTATLAGELALAMRYYQKSYQQGDAPGTNTANGANRFRATTNTGTFAIETAQRFIVPMRVSPTFTWYSTQGTSGKITNAGAELTVSGTYDYSSTVSPFANVASSITAGNDVQYHFTASAEL